VAYSAPEVFQGQVTQRSDQFSLAVTYCHLRTGKLPFAHHPDRFERGYVRPPPNLSLLDAEERPIVARALSPEPMARWPSCRAFLEPLARLHLTEVVR
jgi:serine/threonine protein kinase